LSVKRPFSWKWVLISIAVFMATEALLGWLVGEFLVGRYISAPGDFRVQGILYLVSYFVGGFVVGVISPGLRLWEPAVGAFFSVASSLLIAVFMPLRFFQFSTWKLLIGGAIAFALALTGAELGEKLTGNLIEKD
jgi:hypothetical protein